MKSALYLKFTYLLVQVFLTQSLMANITTNNLKNKTIPTEILAEAKTALSFYPSLKNTPIEFVIKPSMKKSFMKAQPKFSTLLKPTYKRAYLIFINESFTLEDKKLDLKDIPSDVLVGWLGHELGHVMDYKERSTLNLLWFGIRYYFSGNYIRKAERIADSYAVSHQMTDYIICTKNFILNHADLSDKYKSKIKRLYVSPNEILKIVEEQEKAKQAQLN
ncbi:hypothetical protein [Aquimarina agarivorans]|uniref:hypothetical protein n=1 Tax=Aquimarina agarivorans TaxID=980584 RepID=UPI000248F8BA|nr:hypothetical protein [Aquimarina agarivorans]